MERSGTRYWFKYRNYTEPDNNGTTDLGRDVRMANNVSVADGSLGGYVQ